MEGVYDTYFRKRDRLCSFDSKGLTPLLRAASSGHDACLEQLRQAGAAM